jgi:hypothetical protein
VAQLLTLLYFAMASALLGKLRAMASSSGGLPSSSGEMREQGNALFTQGSFKEASVLYTCAADAAELDSLLQDRVLALSNRAACWLALQRPCDALDDTWQVLSLLHKPGVRDWQRQLVPGAWVQGAYAKALLRRSAAEEAAVGSALSSLPALAWLAARTAATAEHKAAALRAASLVSTPGALTLPAVWSPLSTERRHSAPSPRGYPACCSLDGCVYVFGGDASTDEEPQDYCSDFWRLKLPEPGTRAVRWEKLDKPATNGGPPSSRHATALSCEATGEVLVLDAKTDAWAYSPKSNTWRPLGNGLHLPHGVAESSPRPLLACSAHTLYRLWCSAAGAWELATIPLAPEGPPPARRRIGGSISFGTSPCDRQRAHVWLDDTSCPAALYLWGGAEDTKHGVPGHNVHGERGAPLADLWRLTLDPPRWARVRGDGGGAVPPATVDSALAPLGGGKALLFGGYSELLPAKPPTQRNTHPTARFLNCAHLYDPSIGWRRLHASASQLRPHAAAAACLAFDAASGRAFVGAGWNAYPIEYLADGLIPLNLGLFELSWAQSAEPLAKVQREAEAEKASRWAQLRSGAQPSILSLARTQREAQLLGQLPRAFMFGSGPLTELAGPPPSPQRFDELLAKAEALQVTRPALHSGVDAGGFLPWLLSFSGVYLSATPPHKGWWDVSVTGALRPRSPSPPLPGPRPLDDLLPSHRVLSSGHDWESNIQRTLYAKPQRIDALVGPAEPTAGDFACALLRAITEPQLNRVEPGAPPRKLPAIPCYARFSARMAHLIDPLHPLLERLGIAIRVEPWGDSAVSSLRNGVSPWGDNQLNDDAPGRCKCCFTIRSKAALRLCSGCKKARYWCVLTPGSLPPSRADITPRRVRSLPQLPRVRQGELGGSQAALPRPGCQGAEARKGANSHATIQPGDRWCRTRLHQL